VRASINTTSAANQTLCTTTAALDYIFCSACILSRTLDSLHLQSAWCAPEAFVCATSRLTACIDVNRHGLRPVQLGLLPRRSQLPSTPPPSDHTQTAGSHRQVEYAVKAVENGGTAVGIKCKDGVVLALEKLVTSKLLKPGANKRIASVDRNMGIVSTSWAPMAHSS
jgi:hypothetical protein